MRKDTGIKPTTPQQTNNIQYPPPQQSNSHTHTQSPSKTTASNITLSRTSTSLVKPRKNDKPNQKIKRNERPSLLPLPIPIFPTTTTRNPSPYILRPAANPLRQLFLLGPMVCCAVAVIRQYRRERGDELAVLEAWL